MSGLVWTWLEKIEGDPAIPAWLVDEVDQAHRWITVHRINIKLDLAYVAIYHYDRIGAIDASNSEIAVSTIRERVRGMETYPFGLADESPDGWYECIPWIKLPWD